MKRTPLKTLLLLGATVIFTMANLTPASASDAPPIYSGIRVDHAPPHDEHDPRWESPSRDAVWIAGHYDWIHERWVWVGGYYTYPPHLGAKWVPARYKNGNYFLGHWNR